MILDYFDAIEIIVIECQPLLAFFKCFSLLRYLCHTTYRRKENGCLTPKKDTPNKRGEAFVDSLMHWDRKTK